MSVVSKNSMTGAGDCLAQPKKLRTPVASSRRFATRGVQGDPSAKKKLKEALETFMTPPQSPLQRRSRTSDDIKLGKNVLMPCRRCKSPEEHARMADAGRRVSHQLVLNAWRRRRRQASDLVESRDRLQNQVDQLQMQVDVLLKLREAEGQRRNEAVSESKGYAAEVATLQGHLADLQQTVSFMESNEEKFKEIIDKLNLDLMNERNTVKSCAHQKSLCEQAYTRERQQLQAMREERKKLLFRIEECEKEVIEERNNTKMLNDVIKMTEDKYVECKDLYSNLGEKCTKLEVIIDNYKAEKQESEELLINAQKKNDKLDTKIHELKKTIATNKMQKKKVTEENAALIERIKVLEEHIDKRQKREWWKTGGEFMVSSLVRAAYVLFPALPPETKTVNGSIGLGTL